MGTRCLGNKMVNGTVSHLRIPIAHENAIGFGDKFTLSFTYRGTLPSIGPVYLVYDSDQNLMLHEDAPLDASGKWARFSQTLTIPMSVSVNGGVQALLVSYNNADDICFEVMDGTLKLEPGEKETDWIPVQKRSMIECYVINEKLARDVCWAMCRAPSCHDVMVTKLDGYGYHIDCMTDFEGAINQVRSILGRRKSDHVDWLI